MVSPSVLTTWRNMEVDQQPAGTVPTQKDCSMVFDDVLDGEMQKQPAAGAPVMPSLDQGRTGEQPKFRQPDPRMSPRPLHAKDPVPNLQEQVEEAYRHHRSHRHLRRALDALSG